MGRPRDPIALFIPCYVDQFYPQVGIATLTLLEKLGCEVVYPKSQTCCGQPFANSGYRTQAAPLHYHFNEIFSTYRYIVCPSGSCTQYVQEYVLDHEEKKVYELIEFLHDVLGVTDYSVSFPYKVGIHQSCHGVRGLGLAKSSELNIPPFNKTRAILETVKDIQIMSLSNPDECCGFGGTFSVMEEAVSVSMGKDRLLAYEQEGVEMITGNDMSCLMHLEGLLRRAKSPIRVCHISEILTGSLL